MGFLDGSGKFDFGAINIQGICEFVNTGNWPVSVIYYNFQTKLFTSHPTSKLFDRHSNCWLMIIRANERIDRNT